MTAYLANPKELSCSGQVQVVHLQPLLVHNSPDSAVIHLHGAASQAVGLLQGGILQEELLAVLGRRLQHSRYGCSCRAWSAEKIGVAGASLQQARLQIYCKAV